MSIFDGFKFRKVSSPIHNLDPRAKFIYVCVMFIVAILFIQIIPLLVLFIIQLPLIFIARVHKQWIRSMKGSALFAVLIFGMNAVSLHFYGGLNSLGAVIERSLAVTIRFLVLIESFSVFFLTTSPDHLGLALEQSGFPYDLCFAFTTAVRFVPVLAEEAQTIMDAQRSRGLELDKGNLITRMRNYIPILIPLIVNAIRRSLELAEAMESRAWGATSKRTNLYTLKMEMKDYYLICTSFIILTVFVYIWLNVHVPSLLEVLGY
ncbi:TPA: energy-coupling factor transporter transmembrane protein EcfT [Candidatus Bathyarchaeota archaeon]|nr:energy-coupling factor transporter transmembrane protein EcfT [Candidatus Bathyarchaeota archaeon]